MFFPRPAQRLTDVIHKAIGYSSASLCMLRNIAVCIKVIQGKTGGQLCKVTNR